MPEKKLTPEQVKQLNANAAKMDEQGYSLDEIKAMASEYFDKFAREEPDDVNFTKGSVEQQEQPTEPSEKPIVDKVNLNPYTVTTTSLADKKTIEPKTTYDDSFRGKFKQLLDEEVEKIDDDKSLSQEEQSDVLNKLTKRAEQIEIERAGIEVPEDDLFEKTSAQKALDELVLKKFPIEVINLGGRNVSPTIENAEKLTQLDPFFSDFMYSKVLNQPKLYDKLIKGQVTKIEEYDILSEYNSIKMQNSYNNLQVTINENDKLVKEIDDLIEKQKESMLSTPYFISDLDGNFSVGEINSPEEKEEAQSMYDELSSLYEDKAKQSTSPSFSKEYIEFLNASAKQEALETGEYENIHKKIKENQLYAEELMDGSFESFAKDFGARGVNTVLGFVANTMASVASGASSYRDLTGDLDDVYGVSDMVIDWAERVGSPMVTSERSFAMKDPLTEETRYDAGDFALSITDQLGLFLGLALGNKSVASREIYKLSKIGVTGKRASQAMKISQRYNTLITGTMASHTHTYREAREMGLSGRDLFVYATFMSTLEGFSELIFPNQGIFGKDLKDIGLKAFVKNLSKGRRVALKDSLKQILEGMGSEAAEEYLVLLGKMAETSLISLSDDKIKTYIPEFEEIISTGAIAAAMAGGSTAAIQTYQNITGAKRKEVMSYAISKGTEVDFNGLTEAVEQQVKQGNVSAQEATMYLAQVHEANDFKKYIPDEIKGRTRQELLPIAKEIDSLTKQSKEKEGVAKKALQERIKVLEGYMESKIKGESITQTPSYDKPTVFTTPTSERYGTVNRQDGKGDVVLTEEEYNAEMEIFTPVEEVTPTEEALVATEAKLKDAETATQRLANRTKEQEDLFGDQHTDKKLPYGAAEISDITTTDKNGVTTATYVNPETKSVDAIITATNKGNFVGYVRVYENGKPTDMFTAKMQASESGVFKNIITSAENTLPDNAEVVETTTISTGGLKSYNKSRLVEKVDEDGNVVTRPTKYSDATKESVKEKGEAAYKPFKTTDKSDAEAEIAKIKEAYPGINAKIIETKAPPRPPQPGKKPRGKAPNQYSISIDLPVLVKPEGMKNLAPTEEAAPVTEAVEEVAEETVVAEETFEQKKSEIESRRQAELEANSRFTGEKVIVDQINAKYDAELSRLEAQESQKEESKKAEEKTTDTTTDTQETTEGAETTSELSEEQVSEINRILGLDESERKSQRQGRTKRDNQRLDKVGRAIELLKQSLSEVMPNIVIYVAENSDAFAVVANEQKDRKQDRSSGFFTRVDGKYVIVLNPDSADVTTVFHEGLHAVLRAAGLPNTMARAITSRMVEAVKKTATKKLQKELKAFTELYETPLQSEEYIAELIGILANNYNEQNNETKSVIRRWLQKLAEMLGLKPKGVSLSTVGLNNTDAATIDALNFVAKKMSEGGVLTEQDLTRLVQPGKEQQGDGSEETVTRKQKAAIEILDGPKFDKKKKQDVAAFLNGLRDSVIPPDSSKEDLISRFVNNIYEEVGYYLYSKEGPREAGLTWYIEDMKEFGDKIKIILPELKNENQYKLFLSILAITSSGTNPNQNLLYSYNLWNNSKNPSDFNFSKNWGDMKMSFIDKKGKALGNGVIQKETAREYVIELIDSLGRPVKDRKGNIKTKNVKKNSLKNGYPKSTGYTNRGEIVIGQLEKLEKIYKKLGSLEAVVEWLQTPHSIAELREYNISVPDINGKSAGKTNKVYDPKKNAEGERNGAFIFGEKIGSFYQNMIGIGETITMDLWWSRTWNRYMGTMFATVKGKTVIQETPRTDRERNIMREAVKMVAEDLNLDVSELQAAIWYFEQELWTNSGNASPSYSYVTAIDDLTKKLKVDEKTKSKLQEARADLSAAEKRRQTAAKRAVDVVSRKSSEETVTRKQKRKKPKSKIKDVFEYGIQKGFSAESIKNHLIKLGYTKEEVDSGAYDAEKVFNNNGKKVSVWLGWIRRRWLSARSFMPKTMFRAMEVMNSSIDAESSRARKTVNKVVSIINKLENEKQKERAEELLNKYLTTGGKVGSEEKAKVLSKLEEEFGSVGTELGSLAFQMRTHIDSLTEQLIASGIIKAEDSVQNIKDNIGVYMNRSFEVFDNKNWKDIVSQQVIDEAKNYLRISFEKQMSENNAFRKNVENDAKKNDLSIDEQLNILVDNKVNEILSKSEANDYISQVTSQKKIGAQNLTALKRRKDIPVEIRALMGEYSSPSYNYAISVYKIANLVAKQKFQNTLAKQAKGIWLFEKNQVKPSDYVEIKGESMGSLQGLYAPPEVISEFQNAFEPKEISKRRKVWLTLVGAVKYSKTILSVGTHFKNIFGNLYFMAQNGYLFKFNEFQKAYDLLKNDFKGKATIEMQEKLDEYIRAGIIGQGASIGEIKAMFESTTGSFENSLEQRISKKSALKDRILATNAAKKIKRFGKGAQQLYQYEDDMFKIVAYEAEKKRYSQATYGKTYDNLSDFEKSNIDSKVEEIVKNILPNYGRIGGLGKSLKNFPIAGTFISFQLESYRTAANTITLATDEILSENKEIKKIGAKRLAATIGVQIFKFALEAAATGLAMSTLSEMGGDDDDEDDDNVLDAVKSFLPSWDTNSQIMLSDLGNGKFKYRSISASDPYGTQSRVFNAVYNLIENGDVESAKKALYESGSLLNPDILLTKVVEILNNENSYGGKIYNEDADNSYEKTYKAFKYLWQAFEPGTVTSLKKVANPLLDYKEQSIDDKITLKQLGFDTANELLGQATGFKSHTVDVSKQAYYKFQDINEQASNIKQAYYKEKRQFEDGKLTIAFGSPVEASVLFNPADQEEYNKLADRRKKELIDVYNKAINVYKNATILGVENEDLIKSMGSSGKNKYPIAKKIIRQIVTGQITNTYLTK